MDMSFHWNIYQLFFSIFHILWRVFTKITKNCNKRLNLISSVCGIHWVWPNAIKPGCFLIPSAAFDPKTKDCYQFLFSLYQIALRIENIFTLLSKYWNYSERYQLNLIHQAGLKYVYPRGKWMDIGSFKGRGTTCPSRM